MLFLKYLDDMETERAMNSELEGRNINQLFEERFRWSNWATPKTADGKPDKDRVRVGPDLIDFVNNLLTTYLRGLRQSASGPVGNVIHRAASLAS
jgi:type I restriction enzyme M protein